MLVIVRWSEMDGEGMSWWSVHHRINQGDKELPSASVMRRVFKKVSRAKRKLEVKHHGFHAYLGMQIGLPKSDRTAFLKALEAQMR